MTGKCFFISALICLSTVLFAGCDNDEDKTPLTCSIYGIIGGEEKPSKISGIQVSLENMYDSEDIYFAVSDSYGNFEFHDIPEGTYLVKASKNGKNMRWIWLILDGGEPNHKDNILQIKGSSDKHLEITFFFDNTKDLDFDLDITDIYGNIITSSVKIQKNSSSVTLCIRNNTNEIRNWYVSRTEDCCILGWNPPYPINIKENTFTSFSPKRGELNPGETAYLTGIINPQIYTYTEIAYSFNEITITTKSADKTINFYFE